MKIWPPLGLCTQIPGKEDEPVPLLRCEATADIAEDNAGVRLEQYFSNPSFGGKKNDQEAVYKFPLIGNAAVYFFKSEYLSADADVLKTLVGKAKEKQQAREEYEEAKANGKAAQLLEIDYENSPDLFVMSLGNIPSNCKTVKVQIAFHCPLQTEEKGVVKRFTLPAVLTGRYGKYTPSAFKEANVKASAGLFHFNANICLGDYVASLESPSHKVTSKLMVDGTPNKANVSFTQDDEPLDKDLVLKISSGGSPKSSLLVQAPESIPNEDFSKDFADTTIAKLTFNCDVAVDEDAEVKKNFVFVVDRSGSMSGASMKNCKKALLLCLTSLPENCCFDICSFGSHFDFLFGGKSKDYSEDTLNQARAHVEAMSANYGGTEILQPLQKIVEAIIDIPTVVFLLTDGQVYNTANIVSLIKKEHEKSGTTVFTCGIGSGVDRNLVDGLAKAGGGTATYIAYGEKMNAKLAAQMEQAIEPPCINLKVDLGPLRLSSSKLGWTPVSLLPAFVYSGQRVDCYLPLDSNSVLECKKVLEGQDPVANVTLTGKMKIEDKEETVVVAQVDLKKDFQETNSNLIVPAFRQQIKIVEEAIKAKKSEKKKAVKFAVAANIVTKYTSLVAVEVGDEANVKESTVEKARPLPVPDLAIGSGGFAMPRMAMLQSAPIPARTSAPAKPQFRSFASTTSSIPPVPAAPMRKANMFMNTSALAPPPPPTVAAEHRQGLDISFEKKSSAKGKGNFFGFGRNKKKTQRRKKDKQSAKIDLDSLEMAEDEALPLPSTRVTMGMAMDDMAVMSAAPPMPAKSEYESFARRMSIEEEKELLAPVINTSNLATDDDKLAALIGLQLMNGSFTMSDGLKDVVGTKDFGDDGQLPGFATALVVKFLEIKLAALSAEWKLMRKKAVKWLKKNTKDHKALLETAAKYI